MDNGLIKDNALAEKIAAELETPVQGLTPVTLKRLTDLDAADLGIVDLTGLQHCINLTHLSLQDNRITDISPLAGLIDLELLSLNGNPITDASPLKSLKALRCLYLGKTLVSDLSFVHELHALRLLSVVFSKVTTLEEVHLAFASGEIARLETLYAFGNMLDAPSRILAPNMRNDGVDVQI